MGESILDALNLLAGFALVGGVVVLVLPVIYLPALLFLLRGRLKAGFGVAVLCLAAVAGALLHPVPALALWAGLLGLAVWRAARARAALGAVLHEPEQRAD